MFRNGTLRQRYNDALYVKEKAKKAAKICGIFYMILVGLTVAATVFATTLTADGLTAGALILALAGFPLGYLTGRICGNCLAWTYFWLERKFGMEAPIMQTMFVAAFVGFFVWLKYRRTSKKLEKQIRKQEYV